MTVPVSVSVAGTMAFDAAEALALIAEARAVLDARRAAWRPFDRAPRREPSHSAPTATGSVRLGWRRKASFEALSLNGNPVRVVTTASIPIADRTLRVQHRGMRVAPAGSRGWTSEPPPFPANALDAVRLQLDLAEEALLGLATRVDVAGAVRAAGRDRVPRCGASTAIPPAMVGGGVVQTTCGDIEAWNDGGIRAAGVETMDHDRFLVREIRTSAVEERIPDDQDAMSRLRDDAALAALTGRPR